MAVGQDTKAASPLGKGGLLWQRKGPLPVWAWLALLLLALLVVVWWRRNQAGVISSGQPLPGDQTAPQIIILPSPTNPPTPPGGGRDEPPTTPPPTPGPTPTPPGLMVTVARYTSNNPPWNSTLWGIAQHFHIPDWRTIWNHPLNADLKRERGDARRIRPGDRIFVPGAR